jgi:hypothetical protein
MKTLKELFKNPIPLLLITAFAVTLALPFLPRPITAHAQMLTYTATQFTTTNVLQAATTYIVASNRVAISKDRGIALTASLTPGAVTNVATLNFHVSPDGTNWAWSTPHVLALNLTTVATNYVLATNLGPDVLNNFQFIRLYSIVTANTNLLTNSVWWSQRY